MPYSAYIPRWAGINYRNFIRQKAVQLGSDGCTGVPDFYLDGCLEHDVMYRTGRDPLTNDAISREEADRRLRWYIQIHSLFGVLSPMAWWRWLGVRLCGASSFQGRK